VGRFLFFEGFGETADMVAIVETVGNEGLDSECAALLNEGRDEIAAGEEIADIRIVLRRSELTEKGLVMIDGRIELRLPPRDPAEPWLEEMDPGSLRLEEGGAEVLVGEAILRIPPGTHAGGDVGGVVAVEDGGSSA